MDSYTVRVEKDEVIVSLDDGLTARPRPPIARKYGRG